MAGRIVSFASADGLKLEGRLTVPTASRGVAVLCHAPEPANGLMPNVLMPSLRRSLEQFGWASLRFNYRGVGRSEGSYGGGLAETADVQGAIAYVRRQVAGVPCALIAWSSGAILAIRACIGLEGVDAFIGIAPPVTSDGQAIPNAKSLLSWRPRTLLIAGSNDTECSSDDLQRLGGMMGADVETLSGADHGFTASLEDLGARITWFLR